MQASVFWAGTAAIVLEVGVVWLVYAHHRAAPAVAAIGGLALAAGYLFVHFTPSRSWLSDSLAHDAGVTWFSWFAASFETATALWLGLTGLALVRRAGGFAASLRDEPPSDRPLREALTHPVVLAGVIGNAVILAVSLASL